MLITLARTRCYQACSAVFILDSKGKLLISRNYRGDIPMSVAEKFANRVMEEVSSEHPDRRFVCIYLPACTVAHLRRLVHDHLGRMTARLSRCSWKMA